MTLIFFHRFLIACAILFSIGFAVNRFQLYQRSQDVGALGMTIFCAVATVALGLYLKSVKMPGRPEAS